MENMQQALSHAINLVAQGDSDLLEIVGLSLRVSLSATAIACLAGLPTGALLAVSRFPGRNGILALLSALMGLPPVVVGLAVYVAFSALGPFGWLELLYTPTVMIVAQAILVFPIVTTLACGALEALHDEYSELFRSLCLSRLAMMRALLRDARHSLLTAAMAGFGRAIGEVGAIIVVGGNINHYTRTMTTTIALETSRGNLPLAMLLGVILLAIALAVNAVVAGLRANMLRSAHA